MAGAGRVSTDRERTARGALPVAVPPFPVTATHVVLPAPRPLGDAAHVVLDDAWPAALHRRLERLTTDRDGVVVVEPGGPRPGLDDALRRAWDLLPVPREGTIVQLPHLASEVDLVARRARATGPEVAGQAALLLLPASDLLLVGWLLACADDLVVVRRTGPSAVAAELLGVTFPSGWSPRHRAGASLLELHAPVADGERLRRATPALSEMLLTKGPHVQHVWGLSGTGRLDDDPSASVPGPLTGRWWLRVERQTTVPLGDRALFTIRPWLTPLSDLSPAQRRTLDVALASMSPESRAYKGVPAGGLPRAVS